MGNFLKAWFIDSLVFEFSVQFVNALFMKQANLNKKITLMKNLIDRNILFFDSLNVENKT